MCDKQVGFQMTGAELDGEAGSRLRFDSTVESGF